MPEHHSTAEIKTDFKTQLQEMVKVFRSPFFWSIAPLTAISSGAFLAIHGLWIKPWLRDVADLGEQESSQLLFLMTLSVIMGYFLLGIFTERLSSFFNMRPISVGVFGMFLFSLAQFSLAFGWLSNPMLLVLLLGFLGTSNILIYAGLFQIFPKSYSGRVSTILNVQVFMGAFLIQWGIGEIIELWSVSEKGYDPASYSFAIGGLALLQIVGLVWFFISQFYIKNKLQAA